MIQVINRALNILEFIANNSPKEQTLTEISDSLNFQHSTCANILKTLVNRGYVEQPKPKGSYRLGKMVYQLTDANKKYTELINMSRSLMVELRDHINETIILSVIKNNKRVLLNEIPSTHEIHVQTKKESSVYSATTGRMILAHYTPENINWVIERTGLPTEEEWSGISSKEILIQELKEIKAKKIIETLNKNHVVGLATPIYKDAIVIASLGIYLPEIRFGTTEKEFIKNELLKTSNKLNQIIAQST
jgi:DNA-binding IclR family transcriptional regulator